MEIVSWNCKNGFDVTKAETIGNAYQDAAIFVIQECRRTEIYNFKNNWKFKNWYGDDQEYSDLGIAVFSNKFEIKLTEEFNRNYRYVVPYKVDAGKIKFTLFAVWTKPIDEYYDANVTEAINFSGYKNIIDGNVIMIGDYNTGCSEKTEEHKNRYVNLNKKMEPKGFMNCSPAEKIYEMTFFSDRTKQEYVNDFCFISKNLSSSLEKFGTNKEWEEKNGIKRWRGLSDHCPIIVDLDL